MKRALECQGWRGLEYRIQPHSRRGSGRVQCLAQGQGNKLVTQLATEVGVLFSGARSLQLLSSLFFFFEILLGLESLKAQLDLLAWFNNVQCHSWQDLIKGACTRQSASIMHIENFENTE